MRRSCTWRTWHGARLCMLGGFACAVGAAVACNALSGLSDLQEVGQDASGPTADAGAPDQSSGDVIAQPDHAADVVVADHGDGACSPDLAGDPSNCGACGHSCLGGACSTGACQPVALATGPPGANGIAVDAVNVYWTVFVDAGVVMQAPITKGVAVTLSSNLDLPFGIVTTATDVFFTQHSNGDALAMVPIGGGATTVVNPGAAAGARHLTINLDAGALFWANENNGVIVEVPFGASSYITLEGSEPGPTGIAADARVLYWVNSGDGTVASTAVPTPDGGAPIILAQGSANPHFLTMDATTLYWTTETGGEVLSVPKLGGTKKTLATGQASPDGIAVDATEAYWVNRGDGTVMRVALTGGPAVTLATGQAAPTSLVNDATSLYWTNAGDGTIMRLAK